MRRRERELLARVEELIEQRDEARADAAAHLGTAKRLVVRNVHLSGQLSAAPARRRLDRLVHAVVRLRRELAAQCRVNDRLSDQLMNSMGYNAAGLLALGVAVRTTTPGDPK